MRAEGWNTEGFRLCTRTSCRWSGCLYK